MKITNLTNYKQNNNISFGYDKAINDKVNETLKQENSDQARTLIELQNLCNKTEDKIEFLSKKGIAQSSINPLFQIFIPMKLLFSSEIEENYPKLNYMKKEFNHYLKRYEKENSKKTPNYNSMSAQMINAYNSAYENQNEITNSSPLYERFVPKPEEDEFVRLGCLDEIKEKISNTLFITSEEEIAQLNKDYEEYGTSSPNNILLTGPSGCGKKTAFLSVAKENNIPVYILNKPINDDISQIEALFNDIDPIETNELSILFINDIDKMNSYLQANNAPDFMKNIIKKAKEKNIFIVATSEHENLQDKFLNEFFDNEIKVSLPDKNKREEILIKNLETKQKGQNLKNNKEKINKIAEELSGKTNIEICKIVQKASANALKNGRKDIDINDFEVIKKENKNKDRIGYLQEK